MISRYLVLLSFILPLLAFSSPIENDPKTEHRYILQLKNKKSIVSESDLAKHLGIGAKEIKTKLIFPSLSISSLIVSSSVSKDDIENYLDKNLSVISFYIDAKTTLRSTIPNDVDFSEQWNLNLISAPDAWDKTTGGKTTDGHEIVVAIIDNGYDIEHEDLQDNIWINEAETPGNGVDDDENGYIDDYFGVNTTSGNGDLRSRTHGTGVAGIIGAKGNNRSGISGVNWDIKMMLISGAAFVSDIIESYNYALTQRRLFNTTNGQEGALVVATNFSSGIDNAFATEYPLWCAVYDELGQAGILSAVAPPNKNVNIDEVGDMPANCPSEFLMVVNNITRNEDLASDSGYGSRDVDIAAPGDGSISTSIQNSYNDFSGTSASTPHVAGAIGLMYATDRAGFSDQLFTDPHGTAIIVRDIIYSSAIKKECLLNLNVTGARLDLNEALNQLENLYAADNTSEIKIIPNPVSSNSNLFVEYLPKELVTHEVDIFDSMGRWVQHQKFTPSTLESMRIQVLIKENLGAGVYFMKITGNENKSTESFIVY